MSENTPSNSTQYQTGIQNSKFEIYKFYLEFTTRHLKFRFYVQKVELISWNSEFIFFNSEFVNFI